MLKRLFCNDPPTVVDQRAILHVSLRIDLRHSLCESWPEAARVGRDRQEKLQELIDERFGDELAGDVHYVIEELQ